MMNDIEKQSVRLLKTLSKGDRRKQIESLQARIQAHPAAMHGDCFPLEHTFSNGMYCRQITVPAGAFLIGKIHKHDHPSFMLKGEVTVLTESGTKRLKAPCFIQAKAGDKRVGYVHKEMVWVDVFKTNVTDVSKVEDECTVESYAEFDRLAAFRALTIRVIAAEKPGFWSDWTPEQQRLYKSGDWEAFSRARGYSEEEIDECREWQRQIKEDTRILLSARDLIDAAALKNIALDLKGEILKSSKMEALKCHSR